MIKTILAMIEGSEGSEGTEAFVHEVLALAEQRQAHVVFAVLTPAPMVSPKLAPLGTLPTYPGEMRELAESHVRSVQALLPADAQAEVVSQADDVGWIPRGLRAHAPLADLIVVPPRETWTVGWLRRHTIETLLLSSGTPLLLLPAGRRLRPVNHAVLGWKPGAAATHALRALLELAEPGARIDVVSVWRAFDDQPQPALDPVLALLERHGLRANGNQLEGDRPTHELLVDFATQRDADLLAIGGFGQSRVREIALGGVTRSLVGNAPLPVLMAH